MRAAGIGCKALIASMLMVGSLSAGAFSIGFAPASGSHSVGSVFTLGTLQLRGIGTGASALALLLDSMSGATGPSGVDNLLEPGPGIRSAAITITPRVVPEPGSMLLLLSGLLIGGAIQRKTR